MKNAPNIEARRPTDNTLPGAAVTTTAMARRTRVASMTPGNTIELPLPSGERKKFTLVIVPAEQVEKATMVSPFNQRHQGLLTEDSLGDILPSVILHGILEPGMGRRVNGVLEIAKGSRRRASAIMAGADYPVLEGDLTDDEMAALDRISNYYLEPSAFERGRWYRQLQGQGMSLRDIEQHLDEIGDPASRRDITRCIRTSQLPTEVIEAFEVPNDVTPRLGDQLYGAWEAAKSQSELLGQKMVIEASFIKAERRAGNKFSADQVRDALLASMAEQGREPAQAHKLEKRSWGGGKAKMIRAGNKTRFEFAELTPAQVEALERTITLQLRYEKDITKEMVAASNLPEAWLRANLSEGQANGAWTRLEEIMAERDDCADTQLATELRERWEHLGDIETLTNVRLARKWLKEQLQELAPKAEIDVPEVWLSDWGFSPEQAEEAWEKLEKAMDDLVTGDDREQVKIQLRSRWRVLSEPKTLLNIRLARGWIMDHLK